MLDWEGLVRRRLAGLRLDAAEKEEVHRELAAHLEEIYDRLRGNGLSEEDAFRDTMSQVKDWRYLREEICSSRTKE